MRMSQAGNIYSLSPNPQQQSLTYRLFWPICQQTFVTSQVGEQDEGIVYLSLLTLCQSNKCAPPFRVSRVLTPT